MKISVEVSPELARKLTMLARKEKRSRNAYLEIKLQELADQGKVSSGKS